MLDYKVRAAPYQQGLWWRFSITSALAQRRPKPPPSTKFACEMARVRAPRRQIDTTEHRQVASQTHSLCASLLCNSFILAASNAMSPFRVPPPLWFVVWSLLLLVSASGPPKAHYNDSVHGGVDNRTVPGPPYYTVLVIRESEKISRNFLTRFLG